MKCYKVLFTSNGLLLNIGSYIILAIIFLNIILLIEFIYKGFKYLRHIIYKIYKGSKPYKKHQIMNNNDINKTKENTKKKKKNNSYIKEPPNKNTNKNNIKNRDKINDDYKQLKLNSSKVNKDSSRINISLLNIDKEKIKKRNKKFIYYNDYEFNGLNYNKALKEDKRTYPHYYFSVLRMKYSSIFTFYTSNDYNSKSIKISLFLFIFSLYFTINALFFSDSTMHKIYIDKGSFNFIYQIPQI